MNPDLTPEEIAVHLKNWCVAESVDIRHPGFVIAVKTTIHNAIDAAMQRAAAAPQPFSVSLSDFLGPLRPCPFCGNLQAVEHDGEAGVTCTACDAYAPAERWQARMEMDAALALAASQAARVEAQEILAQVQDDVPLPPVWQLEVAAELRFARRWFPKPDLLVLALAEEAGEVVKAALDLRAGKPCASLKALRKECIQTIAMAVRLMEEGDPLVLPEVPNGD